MKERTNHMTIMGNNVDEVRNFTLKNFAKEALNGWNLMINQLKIDSKFLWNKLRQSTKNHDPQINQKDNSSYKLQIYDQGSCESDDVEEYAVSIGYSFGVMSKLLAAWLNFVPYFIFDARLGLRLSSSFVQMVYFIGLIVLVVGYFIANLAFSSAWARVLPGLNESARSLLSNILLSLEIAYVCIAAFCLVWMVVQRDILHQLILFKCPLIKLSKTFQRSLTIRCFTIAGCSAFLSETLITAISLIDESQRPDPIPTLRSTIARNSILALILTGGQLLGVVQELVPLMTSVLGCSFAEHIRLILKQRIPSVIHLRCTRPPQSFDKLSPPTGRTSQQAEHSFLSEGSRKIIDSYYLNTIYEDWPKLENEDQTTRRRMKQMARSSTKKAYHQTRFDSDPSSNQLEPIWSAQKHDDAEDKFSKNYQPITTSSNVYIYKNLIKKLAEIRGIIQFYEQVFGGIHFVYVCKSGFVAAVWLVIGILQMRLNFSKTDSGQRELITLVLRICTGFINLVLINIFFFQYFDHLPSQMLKTRTQLFKINLESVTEKLMDENTDPDWFLVELETSWLFYDHLDRISRETNFVFFGKIQYGKRCLLTILSRELSLIFLIIQLVDIFSSSNDKQAKSTP